MLSTAMPRRLAIAAAAIFILAFGVWWYSPEERVKRRLHAMIQAAQVPASMGDLSRGTRGNALAKFLAPRVEIVAPDSVRDELPDGIARNSAAALYSGLARWVREVTLGEAEITSIQVADDLAEVDFKVDALVQLSSRRPVDGTLIARSRWIKHPDHGWVMERIEWREE